MSRHNGQGAIVGHAQVEGADEAVDTRGGDEAGRAVFVPVVGEELGRGAWRGECGIGRAARRRDLVYRDIGDEVVFCGDGGAQVEEAEA